MPRRFFMFWAIVFVTHQVGVCIFRCTAVKSQNIFSVACLAGFSCFGPLCL